MKDVMCKVFKKSKEAAKALKCESERQLASLKNSTCFSDSKTPDGKAKLKKVSNTHSDMGTYNVVKLDTSDADENVSANEPQQSDTKTRPDGSRNRLIPDRIESAISMISDSLVYELPRPIKSKSFIQQNSEGPTASQPQIPVDVSNMMMGSFNFFSSIQDAILAMFNEDDKTNLSTGKSSATSLDSDSDENILTKMID